MSIVVVDDDPYCRELTKGLLCKVSGNITAFSDCWSAWMHIKAVPAGLVVSDVVMDGMNGMDLLRSIKRSLPMIRCLIMSGDDSFKVTAMKLGADAFLSKPFSPAVLIEAVQELMYRQSA